MTGVDLGHLLKACCQELLLQGVRRALLPCPQMKERRFQLKRRRSRMGQSLSGSDNDFLAGVFATFGKVLKCSKALGVGFGVEDLSVKDS